MFPHRAPMMIVSLLFAFLLAALPSKMYAQEPGSVELERHILIMQEHMLAMHHLMNEIESAKDDRTRNELKARMRQMIKDHMSEQRAHKP